MKKMNEKKMKNGKKLPNQINLAQYIYYFINGFVQIYEMNECIKIP